MKLSAILLALSVTTLSACNHEEDAPRAMLLNDRNSEILTVRTRTIPAELEAAGVARPAAEATLSTKLMASVREVRVREGEAVSAGQVLAVLDARDLIAKDAQIGASIGEAEAMQREAETHARRMRALYEEEAAPKAQLDAAETALARANAGLIAARAGAAELSAVRDYSIIRAPFSGIVTRRFVDAGAFAAPGTPLLTIPDARRLRVSVTAPPEAVMDLSQGDSVEVRIESVTTRAVVEGMVPAGGSVYTVNAIVNNTRQQFLPGSAASMSLPFGTRTATVIPATALKHEGDLTGIVIRGARGDELRWVRVGRARDGEVEIVAGLRDGERILIPAAAGAQ
jgi:RND family efflux transporter MFP subunit